MCLPDSDSSYCDQNLGLLIFIIFLYVVTQSLYFNLVKHNATLSIPRIVNVYTLRMAGVIPFYAFLCVIGYSVPASQPINSILVSIAEGLTIWSFYKLCICGTSGYYDVINNFKNFNSWKAIPCQHCYNKKPECCWQFIEMNIMLILFFRPLFIALTAFADYYDNRNLYMVASLLSGLTLIIVMISLLWFYIGLESLKPGLYLERKFSSIKLIVFVILIENWIFNGLYILDSMNPNPIDHAKSIRLFYLIVAIECFVFSFFFQFFFSTFDADALLPITNSSSNNVNKTSGKYTVFSLPFLLFKCRLNSTYVHSPNMYCNQLITLSFVYI